jgi:hypothetical protein
MSKLDKILAVVCVVKFPLKPIYSNYFQPILLTNVNDYNELNMQEENINDNINNNNNIQMNYENQNLNMYQNNTYYNQGN